MARHASAEPRPPSKFNPLRYVKLIIALAGAAGSAWTAAQYGDGIVTTSEELNVAIAAVGALQVWYVSEGPGNKYGKATIAALAAALVAANSFLSGGITATEWTQIAVAALAAAGILSSKNKGQDNVV